MRIVWADERGIPQSAQCWQQARQLAKFSLNVCLARLNPRVGWLIWIVIHQPGSWPNQRQDGGNFASKARKEIQYPVTGDTQGIVINGWKFNLMTNLRSDFFLETLKHDNVKRNLSSMNKCNTATILSNSMGNF